MQVGISAGTVVTAHLSEVRKLLVDRLLDGPEVERAVFFLPRLVDGHAFAGFVLARGVIDLVISHIGVRGLFNVAFGPTGRVL